MIYDLLAPFYDEINSDVDYSSWADFIERVIEQSYTDGKPELVLDLGCGTGRMTLELAKRGYDMTGIDYSAEMLDIAKNAAESLGLGDKILWLSQDMCDFELYGTVDVTVSCLDCINHITDLKLIDKCFKLVHNYLVPNGLFIFDINGKHKFENVYSDNSYVMEASGNLCIWQNYYNKKNHLCDFYITLFEENSDGRYARYDEMQRERMYTIRTIKKHLLDCGFEFMGAYRNFEFESATDDDERIYIAARCIKE
ncbi:MAG: class I SAM-dependent methyltransferase [Ruminococcaceae bacterium]|nr:class I SAM-dependent methyltransferase [Oscillospiraceae bacterium]